MSIISTRGGDVRLSRAERRFGDERPVFSAIDAILLRPLTPLEARIDNAFAENRLRTVLLAFFAATAVSLASVGLYGTLSYSVNVRRREVGLRLALGAVRGQIVKQFLLQGLGVSFLGCVAGWFLATVFARVLSGMLYGVSPTDFTTLSIVVVLVLAVAAIASLVPAIRAAHVEPMQVLRDE